MEFKWDEELIKEMIWSKLPIPEHYAGNVQKCLDEFKKSKEQKEYEVLSFIAPTYHPTYPVIFKKEKISNKFTDGVNSYTEDKLLSSKSFSIHSIKRVSDGEIFTVGEKVHLIRTEREGIFYIRDFSIKDTQCFASSGKSIMQLEKIKPIESEAPIAFERELQILINKHSEENDSNTPDYILANFLSNCLEAFNSAMNLKKIHLGIK